MDAIEEWTLAQRRVTGLVRELPAERAELPVPACPGWSVRDLLSHMVGLCADVLAGNEPDDHNPRWTGAQIAARRDDDVEALLAEWGLLVEPMREWMRSRNTRPLGDVVIHEQDLRGALGVPGGQDSGGVTIVRDRFVGRFATGLGGLPPIALVAPDWSWTSAGAVGDAAVRVEASAFDLHRALVTRRSAAQLRSWTVAGDVGPYLDAFALLGPLPEVNLTES